MKLLFFICFFATQYIASADTCDSHNTYNTHNTHNTSLKCDVCTMVISEIEFFLLENRTIAEIEQYMENNVCPCVPTDKGKFICDTMASELPQILNWASKKYNVSRICNDLYLCHELIS